LVNVSKYFDRNKVLDGIDLSIEVGELFFLLGPSGCGKTTCLRTIAGFYRPDEGEIYFDERLMNDVPPHKRNTGMVFQNYALWPHMTVYQNVEYGLSVRRIPREQRRKMVFEALQIVHMAEYADRNANQLSGGQQQRIALARALVIKPDVLLLDEPLSNLDAKLRLEMRGEIKRIHSESDITTIYVTHDQKEALSMAQRLAVMRDGRIIQVGTPREVYTRPVNRFVADFIGETNFVHGELVGKDRSGEAVAETPIGKLRTADLYLRINPGEKVLCSIRPESITLSDPGSGQQGDKANIFPVKILSSTYLGDVEEYEVLAAGKRKMKIIVHNPGGVERKPGDEFLAAVSPLDVVFLPLEEDEKTDHGGG
jgi:iron(III) transport system ATP-binding protein